MTKEADEKAQQAIELGNSLISTCLKNNIEENVMQGAFATAWLTLCFSMRMPPDLFEEITLELSRLFREDYEKNVSSYKKI